MNMGTVLREPREGSVYYAINRGLEQYLNSRENATKSSTNLEIEELEQIIKAITVASLSNNSSLLILAKNTHLLLDSVSLALEEIISIFFGLEVEIYNIGRHTMRLELINMLSKVPKKSRFASHGVRDHKRRVHLEYRKKYFPNFNNEIERWKVNLAEPEIVLPNRVLILQGASDVELETLDFLGKNCPIKLRLLSNLQFQAKTLEELIVSGLKTERSIFVMLFPEKSKCLPRSMTAFFFLSIGAGALPQNLEDIGRYMKVNGSYLLKAKTAVSSVILSDELKLYISDIVVAIKKSDLVHTTVLAIREQIELSAKILSALIGVPFVTPDCIHSIILNIVTHKFVFKSSNKSLQASYEALLKIIDSVDCPI